MINIAKAGVGLIKKLATTQAAGKTVKKTVELLGAGEVVEKLAEKAIAGRPDAEEVVEKVEIKTPDPEEMVEYENVVTDDATDENTEILENAEAVDKEVEVVELSVTLSETLTRRLADGDDDNGKGWQCSKYAYYLATGVRMCYGPHPDYGPCHGAGMVDYLITNLGWRECEKKNGAIFTYDSADYGHTGVVVDATTNTVNDANTLTQPLRVDTHQVDLDALGARYAEKS